jgi:phytoene desaturase
MGFLIDALGDLMRRQGIHLRFGTTVERIVNKNQHAGGAIIENDEQLRSDIVVMNADPPYVYTHMMPEGHVSPVIDRRIKHMTYSMGLFVLYFGTSRRYDEIAHHTIWLGPRFKGLLKDVFDHKHLADDFSLYLHRPTATDATMAPKGCDSFYVLSPVPNLKSRIDWRHVGDMYRDRILETLESHLLPGLKRHIVH